MFYCRLNEVKTLPECDDDQNFVVIVDLVHEYQTAEEFWTRLLASLGL